MNEILLYSFSLLSLLSTLMVISAKNPIHSVLFLIFVFANATGLLLLLGVEFLAWIYLIVYVGAIAILFLFVVMMLDIKLVEFNENRMRYIPLGGLLGIGILFDFYVMVNQDFRVSKEFRYYWEDWVSRIDNIGNIHILGGYLYTDMWYYFIVCGFVLLVAMIGAIILTVSHKIKVRRQDIYVQVEREQDILIKGL